MYAARTGLLGTRLQQEYGRVRMGCHVLLAGAGHEHGGTARIGPRGTHRAQQRGIAFLQKLRLLRQPAIFSAFTLRLRPGARRRGRRPRGGKARARRGIHIHCSIIGA